MRRVPRRRKFCTCTSKQSGWSLQKGLWVHPDCGLPSHATWLRLQ